MRVLMKEAALCAAAFGGVFLVGAAPAAAASGLSLTFAGVGLVEMQNGATAGPSDDTWSTTSVVLGTTPVIGTMTLNFSQTEVGPACPYGTFTVSANGGAFSGVATGQDCTSASGTVTAASGSYSNLQGQAVSFTFTVTPVEAGLGNGLTVISSNPSDELSPSVLVGSMTVA